MSIKARDSSSVSFKIFSIKFLGKSLITFEFISDIISKINQNNFGKSDFDNLSNKENIPIKIISLKNQNDDQILKKELINQIYSFSEKKVIVVHDIEFAENFLIYIDKIENVRRGNNINWMNILRVAFQHSPQESSSIFKNIFKDDKKINKLSKKLF